MVHENGRPVRLALWLVVVFVCVGWVGGGGEAENWNLAIVCVCEQIDR